MNAIGPLFAMRIEQRLEAPIVDIVGMALDPDQPLGERVEAVRVAAYRAQQRHGLGGDSRSLDDDPVISRIGLFELGDLIERDRLGGPVHLIDGVVHRSDQAGDGAAIERRDQDAPHILQHLANDVIRLVLLIVDFLAIGSDRVSALEEPRKRVRPRHQRLRMFFELLEEAALTGHQFLEPPHARYFLAPCLPRP